MSTFITQTGSVVTCEDPTCSCNAAPAHSPTAAGVLAADEERWFDALCDAVDEYLNVMRQQQEAPKSDQASFEARLHEAKREVIDRFYAMGWDK